MFYCPFAPFALLPHRQYLQRQHSLKLRMKAAEIQQEIEDDKRVLEELQRSLEAQTEAEQTKRKNQRNELQWLNRVRVCRPEAEAEASHLPRQCCED